MPSNCVNWAFVCAKKTSLPHKPSVLLDLNPVKPLSVALRHVPLTVLNGMARTASWAVNDISQLTIKRVIGYNLALAYPHLSAQARQQLAEQTLTNQYLNAAAALKSWVMPPDWSVRQIRAVHGQQVLTDALASGNGVLAIVPHLGCWEMMNAWLNQFAAPTIMYKPTASATVDALMLQGRERVRATLVPTDARGVKAVLQTLKQGGFSIVLPDHVPEPSSGAVVPFFGVPTLTGTLTTKLAARTGCRLVGLSCLRGADGNGFAVYCDALTDTDLWARDATRSTAALNRAIEAMIARDPAQYVWGYRRFKGVPNFKGIYRKDWQTVQRAVAQFHGVTAILPPNPRMV